MLNGKKEDRDKFLKIEAIKEEPSFEAESQYSNMSRQSVHSTVKYAAPRSFSLNKDLKDANIDFVKNKSAVKLVSSPSKRPLVPEKFKLSPVKGVSGVGIAPKSQLFDRQINLEYSHKSRTLKSELHSLHRTTDATTEIKETVE